MRASSSAAGRCSTVAHPPARLAIRIANANFEGKFDCNLQCGLPFSPMSRPSRCLRLQRALRAISSFSAWMPNCTSATARCALADRATTAASLASTSASSARRRASSYSRAAIAALPRSSLPCATTSAPGANSAAPALTASATAARATAICSVGARAAIALALVNAVTRKSPRTLAPAVSRDDKSLFQYPLTMSSPHSSRRLDPIVAHRSSAEQLPTFGFFRRTRCDDSELSVRGDRHYHEMAMSAEEPVLRPESRVAQGLGKVAMPYRDVVPPIYVSTTYERGADGTFPGGRIYSRADNPSYDQGEALIAALEGASAALLFASGQAAAASVFQALTPGDCALVPRNMYWA